MPTGKSKANHLRRSARQQAIVNDASIVIDDDSEHEISQSQSQILNKTTRNKKNNRNRRLIQSEDEESVDEEIEEEIEESAEEVNEEDNYIPATNKKKAKPQQKTNKRQKKQKHSNIHTSKELVSNIDDVENYVENPIFESLSSNAYLPSNLAQSWIDDFTTEDLNTKFDALKDFVNFILRCSGCIVQLNRHDVTNTENAKETVNEIQTLFARQKYHEFPMMYAPVNNKDWKEFPENAVSFISEIIVIAGETGILYEEDGEFVELLLEWISAMSTSNIRALRYVSTLFGLTIQSVLCKISVNISKFIDKFLRQLKKENDSLKSLVEHKKSANRQLKRQVDSANERIKVIENNLEMYKKQKKAIDSYVSDFFNTLFVHRYRDVAYEIRLKCVNYLGNWMDEYPEMFFESSYLRYLGWLLTDQDSNIRSEIFKVLIRLYKKRSTVAALRQFTSYFKNKLIEIVIYETDFNARSNCLLLLTEIIEKGYLNDDDIIQLTSLIFVDDEDLIYPYQGSKLNPGKFLKELAKFVSKVEILNNSVIIERDDIELDTLNETLPLDCKKLIKIKSLLNILFDSYEYYQTNYSTAKVKNKVSNSKLEKITNIFQYLYHLKNYNDGNEMFELLISYVNFDFSAYEISEEIRESIELDSKTQSLLLNLISAASLIYIQGHDNQFYRSLFPQTRTKNVVVSNKDNNYYILKLLSKLSDLCYYFHDDIEKISILVNLTGNLLKFENIDLKNRGLVDTISQFLRFFLVINFPLCSQNRENSKFFDSITYQYINFFKLLLIEETNLISIIDSIFTELSVIIDSKIDDKLLTVIESINKLYILSHCPYISTKCVKEFNKTLPIYCNSLLYQLDSTSTYISSNDVIELSLSNRDDISSFLHISNHYINKALLQIYEDKLHHSNEDIENIMHANLDTINAINVIQKSLSLLIQPNEVKLNMDMVHEIAVTYLNNIICISAFKAEIGSLVKDSNSDEENLELNQIHTLRSHINKIIQQQLMKLFCVREFQLSELLGTDTDLERDAEEDVNFSSYSVKNIVEFDNGEKEDDDNDDSEDEDSENNSQKRTEMMLKKKEKYEILLCEIASKLTLCCSLELIDEENDRKAIIQRITLNSQLLGDMYKKVLHAVGILVNYEPTNEIATITTKSVKQQSILNSHGIVTRKKRKLIEEDEESENEDTDNRSEEDEEDDRDGGEDVDDPIESDSELEDGKIENEEEVEFSEIEDDDSILDSSNQNKAKRIHTASSEISSFASSFPYTQ